MFRLLAAMIAVSAGPQVGNGLCDPASTSVVSAAQLPGDLSWGQPAAGFQMAVAFEHGTGNVIFFIRNATDKPLDYEQGVLRYWETHSLEYLSGHDWVALKRGARRYSIYWNALPEKPHAVLAPNQVVRQQIETNLGDFVWPKSVLNRPSITLRLSQEMLSREGGPPTRLYSAPVIVPGASIRVQADRSAAASPPFPGPILEEREGAFPRRSLT